MFRKAILFVGLAAVLPSCAKPQAPPSPADASAGTIDLRDNSELDNAIAMVAQLQYESAAQALTPLAAKYQAGNDAHHAATAIFWLGYCQEKLGKFADAQANYRRLLEKYGQTDAARNAQDRLDAISAQPR